MTDPARRADLDDLLAHRRWVRAVALRLASNAADADDLEQDAWLAALRHPPRDESPRAWLGTVLRNLLRTRFRQGERRARHETAAGAADSGRREPAPSAEDVVAAAELQTRLARAVLDLDEPYRATLLFRYFEDLDPHEIARRTGAPLETVRTRLKRGIAMLRERIGQDAGPESRAWCVLVAGTAAWPGLPPGPAKSGVPADTGGPGPGDAARAVPRGTVIRSPLRPAGATVVGGLAMGLTKKVVVAACVLLLAFAAWKMAPQFVPPGGAPGSGPPDEDVTDAAAEPRRTRARLPADVAPANPARDAASVTVEVVLPDGRPAAGAAIDVFDDPMEASNDFAAHEVRRAQPPAAARTIAADGAGIVRIEWRAGAPRRIVVARLAGCAAAVGRLPEVVDAPTTPVRIRLGEAFSLSGRVLDAAGAPVAGAQVVAERGTWSPLGSVAARAVTRRDVCDETGAFRLDDLAAGAVPLLAARPGGAFVRAALVRVPEVDRIDVVLAHDHAVTGRVTDAATGRGLASATVRAWMWFDGAGFAQETVTDADGTWRMEHIPVSAIYLSASCAGYPETVLPAAGAAPIELGATSPARCDVALRRGGALSGRVTSPDGPVGGATVTAARADGLNVLRSATVTSADGRYEFPAIVPGEHVVVVAAQGWIQAGFPSMWSTVVRSGAAPASSVVSVEEGGAATLDIALARGLSVAGRVLRADGEPAPGVSVSLSYAESCEWNGPWKWQRISSLADGTFRFRGVAPAESVVVSAYASGRQGTATVALDAVDGADGATIRLGDPRRVVGTVTAPPGIDVAAAIVQGIDWSGSSDGARRDPWENAASCDVAPDGAYSMPLTFGQKRWVRAVVPGRAASAPVEVRVAEDGSSPQIDLALSVDADTRGVVVLPDGRGVAGANVTLRLAGGSTSSAASAPAIVRDVSAVTDADGRFRLGGLLPGPLWEVSVTAAGCAPATVTFRVPLTDPLVVRTTRAARIHGLAHFADGRSAAGVRLQLVGRTGPVPETVSDGRGEFAFEDVLDGAYQIVVMTGGPANVIPCVVPGAVRPGSAADVVVEQAFAVAGRVTDVAGAPPAACYVQIFRAGVQPLSNRYAGGMMAGADGAFSFGGLAAGTFTILASPVRDSKSRELGPVLVEGVAAGTTDVVVRLSAGLVVEGRVAAAAGEAVTGLDISLETPPAEAAATSGPVWSGMFRAHVGDDGRFRIDGLPAGAFRPVLLDRASGRRAALQVVSPATVRAGESAVRLVAGTAGTVRGTVTGEDGAPWYVEVVASPEGDPADVRTVRSEADGTFQFDGLDPSRRWRVRVEYPGLPVARADDVRSGTLDVRLVIRMGKRSSGRLLDADGRPVAKAPLRFRRDGADHVPQTQTADDGTFEVRGLDDAGAWTAEALVATADGAREPGASGASGEGASGAVARSWRACGSVSAGETGAELCVTR